MVSGSGRRALALGAALTALVAVVAFAARGHPAGGGGPARDLDVGPVLAYALLVPAALALAVLPLLAWFLWQSRSDPPPLPARRNWMLRTFGTMALLVVAAAAYLSYKRLHDGGGGGGEGTPGVPLDVPRSPNQTTLPEPIGFDWIPAIVVLSIAVVGAAAGAVLLWHTQRRRPSAARAAAALAAALDESLEDLRSERNARRAVIAAYARMERALGAAGFPRRTAEAPLEYLSRVLRDLVRASAGSVARLTALFERAKFSRHEIGPELKEEAIEALVAVREELRAVS